MASYVGLSIALLGVIETAALVGLDEKVIAKPSAKLVPRLLRLFVDQTCPPTRSGRLEFRLNHRTTAVEDGLLQAVHA